MAYRVAASYSCSNPPAGGTVYLENINVKVLEPPASTNYPIICTKTGSELFERSGASFVNYSTVQWSTNTGWPAPTVNNSSPAPAGGYFMKGTYNITNTNGGFVKVSYESQCANVPGSSFTWNISRTPDNNQPAPTVVNGVGHLCVGQTDTIQLQPYPNAITYYWSSNKPGLLINGQSGVVATTTPMATVQEPTNSYSDAVVSVYAATVCGNTLPRTLNIAVGFLGFAVQGDDIACPLGTSFYWVDPVGNIEGMTYSWIAGGATIQSGQGTYKIRVKWGTGSGPTSVMCRLGKPGCTPYGVDKEVELLECFAALDFTVSPNPAKGNVVVQMADQPEQKKAASGEQTQIEEIRITDKMGNTVLQRKIGAGGQKQVSIGVGHLRSDVYIIQVRSGKLWKSKQIMIQP